MVIIRRYPEAHHDFKLEKALGLHASVILAPLDSPLLHASDASPAFEFPPDAGADDPMAFPKVSRAMELLLQLSYLLFSAPDPLRSPSSYSLHR